MSSSARRLATPVIILCATALFAPPSLAGPLGHLFSGKPKAEVARTDTGAQAIADAVRQALDERRYVDAADLLEKARVAKITSPRLVCLDGELLLAHGQFSDALTMFRGAATDPAEKAHALEGEGLALSMLGKSDQAMDDLKQATAADKSQWRAWNGLGREYDIRHEWKLSQAAYTQALAVAGTDSNHAVVLNNRGYSHLLQNQTTLATADFVAALDKDPALVAARTNLRISMAIDDDRAAVLNNVGLAAVIRGDYREAEKLLNEAIDAKGKYYARASDNLQLAKELEAHAAENPSATPDATP